MLVTLISSYFLLKGSLGLTPQEIASLSGTYWDYNSSLVSSLSSQASYTDVGFFLMLLAFFLQLAHSFFSDFNAPPSKQTKVQAIKYSIYISTVVLCASLAYSHFESKELADETIKLFSEDK